MASLAGKTVIITGGGSGVGAAAVRLFAAHGAKVATAGRDLAKLQKAVADVPNVFTQACDVTDPNQVTKLIEAVNKHFGQIDILVNNAGTNIKARKMRELSLEDWNRLVDTNLNGAFYCIKAVLPQMLARKDGVIVNVNSVSGKRPYPLAGAGYAAGKFGLHALAGCLANEELDSGIRISSIYPGEIDTPILNERPNPISDDWRAKILQPEDVANAILFVATLPPHVSIPELIIKPTAQGYF